MLSAQFGNLPPAQTLGPELNPGALQKRHQFGHHLDKLQVVARYLNGATDPGDCIPGLKLLLADLHKVTARPATRPGGVFNCALLANRSVYAFVAFPIGPHNPCLGERAQ